MVYIVLKIVLSASIIVAIAEVAKRSSFWGAVLASIPLISVMAMIWLYVDTKDTAKISALSTGVFWLVLPSLALFITLPMLLNQGIGFYSALLISSGITVLCYWGMVSILNLYGIKL